MSKFKTPRDKKLASLIHDRRNIYGENDKASRHSIPLRKQASRQALRRAANLPLQSLNGQVDEDTAAQGESHARDGVIEGKRKSFRKQPDAPLGTYLESRETGQWIKVQPEEWLSNPRPKSGS